MKNPNILILENVVSHLEELADEFVFIGGAMVGLYIKDQAVPAVRATIDIDCVVEIIQTKDYYSLAQKLREKGFVEDSSSGVICRYKKNDLILDVMPTDKSILGFSNQWYIDGVRHKIRKEIESGAIISIFSVAYFLAAKIEAFKGRGKNDFRASHDIEDIIAVFDGDPDIASSIQTSPSGADVRTS